MCRSRYCCRCCCCFCDRESALLLPLPLLLPLLRTRVWAPRSLLEIPGPLYLTLLLWPITGGVLVLLPRCGRAGAADPPRVALMLTPCYGVLELLPLPGARWSCCLAGGAPVLLPLPGGALVLLVLDGRAGATAYAGGPAIAH